VTLNGEAHDLKEGLQIALPGQVLHN